MKEDRDLAFLENCKNEDIKVLLDMMTHDKDGKVRFCESLTSDAYLHSCPHNLHGMWRNIANELQHFEGNTLVNACRGEGVTYRSIYRMYVGKRKFITPTLTKQKRLRRLF